MISGVVLAAGTSSRLGRPKQLLDLDGRPLLQHVVDAAERAPLDEVIVVVGHEHDATAASLVLPANARIVVNADYEQGQSTSLRAGLDAASSDSEAALFLLGDQPRVRAETIERVVHAFKDTRRPFVVCGFRDRWGHPVLVARSEWDVLRTITGDKGARDVISRSPEKVFTVPVEANAPEDVDTWDDYERLRHGR